MAHGVGAIEIVESGSTFPTFASLRHDLWLVDDTLVSVKKACRFSYRPVELEVNQC